MGSLHWQQLGVGQRRSHVLSPEPSDASDAPAASAALAVPPAPAVAVAAPAAPALALAPIPAGPDLLRDLCRDCYNELLVFKLQLQWGYDDHVLAYRVQVHVPRVRGSRIPAGGALPFTITAAFAIAIAAAAIARSPSTRSPSTVPADHDNAGARDRR